MVETLAFGYGLIEGPRWDDSAGLYFSDVTHGGVYCLRDSGDVEVVVPKRRGVGGIARHADGGIVISGRNICHVRDGQTRILFERADIPGFNDLFTDDAGRVYTGSMRDDPFRVEGKRQSGEAYRIDSEGDARELYDGVGLTNGIGFSPDRRRLYHADSAASGVIFHQLDASGELVPDSRETFAKTKGGVPDGLTVDEEGGVWTALFGAGKVARFTPDGELDRALEVPAVGVTSVCFAGADRRQLIVVTADNSEDSARGGTIFRFSADEVGVAGLPPPMARI
jgi:gluconolactonase